MLLPDEEIEVGPLFVDALRETGKITTNEFSFALYGFEKYRFKSSDQSVLDIGAPVDDRIDGGLDALKKIQLNDDFFWSADIQGVNFDAYKNDNSEAYGFREGGFTILDTGSSHIFLPRSVAGPIIFEMMKQAGNPDFAIIAGMVFVECTAQFKPM